MHELTLLYGVVDKVGKVVEENGLDHVDAIVIEVGEATSVIPEFLQDGYEVISDDYDFLRGSELIIERIKAIGLCRNCGTEFPIVVNKGLCPECGSFDKEIIEGTDFFIREVMSSDATPSQTAAEQLGAQLATARRARGLTQKELSAMSGVQQAVISRIEGGTSNPTVTLLSTLAETLDMHLELVADQDSAARPK